MADVARTTIDVASNGNSLSMLLPSLADGAQRQSQGLSAGAAQQDNATTDALARAASAAVPAGGAGAAMLIASLTVASAQNNGVLTGVINDASGQPITGAFVKLKNDQKRLTFMVVSREQGRFEAKDLPPGSYRVQGVGGDLQSK